MRRYVIFLSFMVLSQCGGNTLLLSYLTNTRTVVIVKGSYSSDSPLEFSEINGNRIRLDNEGNELAGICDPVGSVLSINVSCLDSPNNTNVYAYDQLPIYLDLAGMRLSASDQNLEAIGSVDESNRFWNVLSSERETYCNRPENLNEQNACVQQDGRQKFLDFFNGQGVDYPHRIIANTSYLQAGLFFRRIVFGFSRTVRTTFNTDANGQRVGNEMITSVGDTNANFDGVTVAGRDIVSLAGFIPGSGAPTPNTQLSLLFPMLFRAGSERQMILDNTYQPAVIEIRIGLKEILSYHRYRLHNITDFVECDADTAGETWMPNTEINSTYEYVIAPIDWRIKHNNNCLENEWGLRMGGNLLMRARIYYPHRTSNIIIANSNNSFLTRTYALFLADDPNVDRGADASGMPVTFTPADPTHMDSANRTMVDANLLPQTLPLAATPARLGSLNDKRNQLRYIMPGSYFLQCREDMNNDGYPERIVGEMPVTVPIKSTGNESILSEVNVNWDC